MATKTLVNKLTNCNVYMDGANLLGRVEELTLPEITQTMAEHKALGMIGTAEFFAGIEKMEATLKWTCFYIDVFQKVANPLKNVRLMIRGSLQTYDGSGLAQEVPIVTYITAAYKTFPLGMYKKSENVEVSSKLAVYYIKQEIAGDQVAEIDILSNIYNVNGNDILATYRANLGI